MVVAPPSFVPQINSLGEMIDTFTQRRMKMAKDQADAEAAQAENDRRLAWDKEKEAYGRRRQDIAEKKIDTQNEFQQSKLELDQAQKNADRVSRGLPPLPSVRIKNGKVVRTHHEWIGGGAPADVGAAPADDATQPEPSPTEQPALPGGAAITGTMMGRPLTDPQAQGTPQALPGAPAAVERSARMPEPVASATPDGKVTAPSDQELEALMAASHGNEQPSDNSVFLDETDDGTANVLMGQNGEERRQLPLDALPPGAKEGQRFAPEDVNLAGGKGNPFAGPNGTVAPEAPPGGKVFVDETDEGNANVLMGPGETERRQLPLDALPPGAREGQRFDQADVNLTGGKGNPFAGAEPQASSTFVPGSQIRGVSARMPPQAGQSGKWVEKDDEGNVYGEIDPGQARAARAAEDALSLRDVNLALASPGLTAAEVAYLSSKKHALMAGMSPKELSQVYAQEGRETLQGNQLASNEKRTEERLASNEKVQAGHDATRIAIVKTKHGGGATLSGIKIPKGEEGSFISIPTNNKGIPQPNQLLKEVTTDWRSWASEQDIKTQFKGLRRLALAQNNIDANGPNSGTLNIEAAFNYLGFLRGGVPVQNETKEMIDHRRTWADSLHGLMARAGIGELIAKVQNGGNLTEEEANRARNVMSPEEQSRIREGIVESKRVMQFQVAQTLQPFVMKYVDMNGPGAQVLRQGAVSQVNAELESAGLPHDFNPFNDTKLRGSGHLRTENPAPSQDSGQGASSGLEQAVQQLLKAKKSDQGAAQ
jgi:hypothetical protein